jgi:hypothetical protein
MPIGNAQLAWSFNYLGEVDPRLLEARDYEMGLSTSDKQRSRQDLVPLAKPQYGVDTLKNKYPDDRALQPLPGVTNAEQ